MILTVLPPPSTNPATIRRIIAVVRRLFEALGQECVFTWANAPTPGTVQDYGAPIGVYTHAMRSQASILVISHTAFGVTGSQFLRHQTVFMLEHPDEFNVGMQGVYVGDYGLFQKVVGNARSHPFNLAAPDELCTIHYFPYGFLWRDYSRGGPINEFGFRIGIDLERIRRRPAEEKLIVFTGGSACFGVNCFYEETMPAVLQTHLDERGGPKTWVLNFAQAGHLVLNEMTSFLLFISGLKPDLVVSHSGANDMLEGKTASPTMLEHQIVYRKPLEEWARRLHASPHVVENWSSYVPEYINFPPPVAAAYASRIEQYATLCKGFGARFLVGLQPFVFGRHSCLEGRIFPADFWALWLKFKPYYEEMEYLLGGAAAERGLAFFNVNEVMSKREADTIVLYDCVHATPAGNATIAACYLEYLEQNGFL